jgi:hypothetical protein
MPRKTCGCHPKFDDTCELFTDCTKKGLASMIMGENTILKGCKWISGFIIMALLRDSYCIVAP